MRAIELSLVDARRVALAAQGFGVARPRRPTRRHVRAVFEKVGAIQIDAVNVLVRSHYLPLFSRLGPYDRGALGALTGPQGDIVEYWVHAACLVPTEHWPAFAWKMRDEHYWKSVRRMADEHPEVLADLVAEVGRRGSVAASDLEQRDRPKEPWWDWSHTKLLLEYLFWTGRVTAGRRSNFERTYALAETRLSAAAIAERDSLSTEDAKAASLRLAARACGVGTARDIATYVGLGQRAAKPFLAAMVDDGTLLPARVQGVAAPAYLHAAAAASRPRRITAAALISPFDSLVWERERVLELFGFSYRIEIYVPKPKRVHGYYVLPFLLGERFVARVDLKAARSERELHVQSAFLEPGEDPEEVAPALMTELSTMARWLDLDDVVVRPVGNLAPHLARF